MRMLGQQCENSVALVFGGVGIDGWVCKKEKLRENRQSVSPGSLSHYHVLRQMGDVSGAATAPLLLDTDMKGSDLCQTGAAQ